MNENAKQQIAAGLLAAAKAEAEGHHFYRMAAQATPDPQGRQMFEQLAREEADHFRFLQAQHDSLMKTGTLDSQVQLGKPHRWEGASPIFSEQIRERLADAHFEMTALSVGIQLELSSERFYQEQAEQAEQSAAPEVERFYRDLAQWESGHYHALLKQQELLKEDYWAAAGFAPF
jgi:rubrerythrin